MSTDDSARSAWQRQSLVDLFREFSDLPTEFLQYDNGYRSWHYSYAQVGSAARRFATRLNENNIRKGDKVIVWCENRPEWVAAFWGCVLAGVIVVPIDYRASLRFLRHVQEIVSARLLVIGDEVQLTPWEGQPRVWKLADLEWAAGPAETVPVRLTRDDLAEIVFTSGATGEPKGVLITHGNILSNIVTPERIVTKYLKWFRPAFPLRFLSLIPLSHMFGQVLTLFILPLVPAVAVFMRGFSPHEILRQIRMRRVSVVVAVPKILEVLRNQVAREFPETAPRAPAPWILRTWRHRRVHSFFGWKFCAFIVGAAPLPRELEAFWSEFGFLLVQGYGLTETAPVVAFNNPFDIREGTVGPPVAGVEVKIEPDGEILVRGESVTPGYYQAPDLTRSAFENGWFRTGDLGAFDDAGNLVIRGRKKEMIVTPEGLNVFPEDVEAVLNEVPGVRESAAVGRDRVHAVLVLEDGSDPNEVLRRANLQLEDHQRVRSFSIWPGPRLPRTESTQKLRHGEIQAWVESGEIAPTAPAAAGDGGIIGLLQKYAPDRSITPQTTLSELGLSSLDRVELLLDLEERFDTSIDESLLTGESTVSSLANVGPPSSAEKYPVWNRYWPARMIRNVSLSLAFLPLTRLFARARVSGREYLAPLRGPVIFAPNHQSHLDAPLVLSALPARYRYHSAVAMWKEYFDAYFFPERHTRWEWFRDRVLYWLVALFFNSFPLPQTEAGALQSLRYLGELVSENWSILFFPEGERTEAGEIKLFQPGIGLIAARLKVPVVPIRLRGVEQVLHRHARFPRPGRVEITFGPPLYLKGQDYVALAKQVREAVLAL